MLQNSLTRAGSTFRSEEEQLINLDDTTQDGEDTTEMASNQTPPPAIQTTQEQQPTEPIVQVHNNDNANRSGVNIIKATAFLQPPYYNGSKNPANGSHNSHPGRKSKKSQTKMQLKL